MKKFIALVAMLLPLAVMAQEKKEASVPVPATENIFRMAAELSKYGYANNDALSLIQAARMAKQAGFVAQQQEKTEETGTSTGDGNKKEKAGNISLDPAKLLADAKAKAGDDGVLLALIDDVQSYVRGAVGGSKYAVDRVNAHSTDTYRISFRAQELAIVTVIGDGDTDLDLYIYDENGNLITSDTDYTDDCVCTFTPRWTGVFVVKIVNRGSVYNNYVLRTN